MSGSHRHQITSYSRIGACRLLGPPEVDKQGSGVRRTHPHRLTASRPAPDGALSRWDVVNTGTLSEIDYRRKKVQIKNDQSENKLLIDVGLVLIVLSSWFFYIITWSILLLIISIIITLMSTSIILNRYNNIYLIKKFQNIIASIVGLIYFIILYAYSFWLIVLSTMLSWAILILIFRGVIELINLTGNELDSNTYEKPILFIATLITGIALSYKGEFLLLVFHKILNVGNLNKKDYSRPIANRILQISNLRKRFYEFSIILYALKVFEDLSKTTVVSWEIWSSYKAVAIEVLLTFVAIDGYINNFFVKSKK
jgi:hypothetical protein